MIASKRFQIQHNVTFKVFDEKTGDLIREHTGHNAATNTLFEGVGHYLAGDGVLRQSPITLSDFVPKYISLGTMGLINQDETIENLPAGISGSHLPLDPTVDDKFASYMDERPGYGSDGYSRNYNNNRPYLGLGPAFTSFSPLQSYYKDDVVYYRGVAYRAKSDIIANPTSGIYNIWDSTSWERCPDSEQPTCWELISPTSPRTAISFRDVVPEYQSETQQTIDVIFSTMISSKYLQEFRNVLNPGCNYIFITEAGLWSDRDYQPDGVGSNGLLAGYRMCPPNSSNWYMKPTDVPDEDAIAYLVEEGITDPTEDDINRAKLEIAANNQLILQQQVLRVDSGQVVQIIWKIQIGDVGDSRGGSMGQIPEEIQAQLDELYALVDSKILFKEDVVLLAGSWVSTTQDRYITVLPFSGIDPSYLITFDFYNKDSELDNFDYTIESDVDSFVVVLSRSKPTVDITIPRVIAYKAVKVSE